MSARAGVGVALGRRHAVHDRLEQLGHALAGLGRDAEHLVGVLAEQLGDLAGHPVGLGARQVDLVQRGDQLEAGVDGQVGVRHGLRLHALRGVHEQQRAVARGERARDLVGEVHVPRRVDQVQPVELAVVGGVLHPHRLRLDRDPALALEIHRVEHLGPVVARVDRPGELEDAVGQRRLPVVDVGDDREVADVLGGLMPLRRTWRWAWTDPDCDCIRLSRQFPPATGLEPVLPTRHRVRGRDGRARRPHRAQTAPMRSTSATGRASELLRPSRESAAQGDSRDRQSARGRRGRDR